MFAYQPAALGDILLAHKSFDVLRRACRCFYCCCCWERRKLAGAADVSIAALPLPLPLATLALCCLLRVPVKPDYGCPQSQSRSLTLPTPARVLPPAHFTRSLSLSLSLTSNNS